MAEETAAAEAKPAKKGAPIVLIVVVALLVVLLAIVGIIGFMLMGSAPTEQEIAQATPAAQPSKRPTAPQGSRGSDYSNIGVMYPLEPFTLNLLTEGGARYIKCTMQLEQSTELLQPELEKKMAIIRDVVIRTLTSKTFEEVSTSKGKERLKDELVSKINEILIDGFVKNIYFTDFVVQ